MNLALWTFGVRWFSLDWVKAMALEHVGLFKAERNTRKLFVETVRDGYELVPFYRRRLAAAGRLGNKQAVKPALTTTSTLHIVTDL